MYQTRTAEFSKVTSQYVSTFGNLTAEQLNWKINPEKWSIAQIIDHIITINETYYPTFKSLKDGTNTTPLFFSWTPLVAFTEKMLIKALSPDTKKKMKTFSIWEPAFSSIDPDIIELYKSHKNELIRHHDELTEQLSNRCKISSPAKKIIVYRLDVAFDIMLVHEQTHFIQAEEVLHQLMRTP